MQNYPDLTCDYCYRHCHVVMVAHDVAMSLVTITTRQPSCHATFINNPHDFLPSIVTPLPFIVGILPFSSTKHRLFLGDFLVTRHASSTHQSRLHQVCSVNRDRFHYPCDTLHRGRVLDMLPVLSVSLACLLELCLFLGRFLGCQSRIIEQVVTTQLVCVQ